MRWKEPRASDQYSGRRRGNLWGRELCVSRIRACSSGGDYDYAGGRAESILLWSDGDAYGDRHSEERDDTEWRDGYISERHDGAGNGNVERRSASMTISTLKVGTNAIKAEYGGDANFAASTSKPVSQVVDKATTTTTLMSSLNPSVVSGQSVTFTATVKPEFSGTATGSVTLHGRHHASEDCVSECRRGEAYNYEAGFGEAQHLRDL